MIEKTIKILNLKDTGQSKSDLDYWLSRSRDERISAVEILRRQYNGDSARLQRVVRIVQQKQG